MAAMATLLGLLVYCQEYWWRDFLRCTGCESPDEESGNTTHDTQVGNRLKLRKMASTGIQVQEARNQGTKHRLVDLSSGKWRTLGLKDKRGQES